MKTPNLIVMGLIFLTGCGTTIKITKLNSPTRQLSPRSPDSVEVFTSTKPSIPYIEVSLISSQQASDFSNDDTPEIIQKMRIEAAHQGCDALIINMTNDSVSGSSGGKYGGSVDTLKGFHGTCVVYKN